MAIARLKLKAKADEEDAAEAIKYYNRTLEMLYEGSAKKPIDMQVLPKKPADMTCEMCLDILENGTPILLEELAWEACKKSEQVEKYLGKDLKMNRNRRLRVVYDMLVKTKNVQVIKTKPVILQWASSR